MNIDEGPSVIVRQFEEEMEMSQGEVPKSNLKKTRLKSGLRKSKTRNTATKSLKSAGKIAAYVEVFS